jgi:hypothetical protein
MPNRLKRWMEPLDEGTPSDALWHRAQLGPTGHEESDPALATRGSRLVAGVTAFAIFAAAAFLGWHAFYPQKPATVTQPPARGAPLVVSVETAIASRLSSSTWTYRGISTSVPPLDRPVGSAPGWRFSHELAVHITVGSPLALQGSGSGTSVEIATGHGPLGAWRVLPLREGVARLPTAQGWYVVQIQTGPSPDDPKFAVAILLLRTTAVAKIDVGTSPNGCVTGQMSVFATESGALGPTGVSAKSLATCSLSPSVTPSPASTMAGAGVVDLPLDGVLAIQGHSTRFSATLSDKSRYAAVYPLSLQHGRAVLGPPGTFILAVHAVSGAAHGTLFFRIGIEDNIDWQPAPGE